MKTPGRCIGGEGVSRLEAGAKNSSEKARMREFSGAEIRSGRGEKLRKFSQLKIVRQIYRCRWSRMWGL